MQYLTAHGLAVTAPNAWTADRQIDIAHYVRNFIQTQAVRLDQKNQRFTHRTIYAGQWCMNLRTRVVLLNPAEWTQKTSRRVYYQRLKIAAIIMSYVCDKRIVSSYRVIPFDTEFNNTTR